VVGATTHFWDWVGTHDLAEAAWQLDSIAVRPELQGRGLGKALIQAGLARARGRNGRVLVDCTAANVTIYGRCRSCVYDEADAPGGGPRVWFMRWDP
jgi:ribosomal protein S18 acetylase RimI-like enzyme